MCNAEVMVKHPRHVLVSEEPVLINEPPLKLTLLVSSNHPQI